MFKDVIKTRVSRFHVQDRAFAFCHTEGTNASPKGLCSCRGALHVLFSSGNEEALAKNNLAVGQACY